MEKERPEVDETDATLLHVPVPAKIRLVRSDDRIKPGFVDSLRRRLGRWFEQKRPRPAAVPSSNGPATDRSPTSGR